MNNIRPRIVVVDNWLGEAASLASRKKALSDSLEFHPERHKGRRGTERPIPVSYQALFIGRLAREAFVEGYCVYQACVAGEQLVYHTDSNVDGRYAAIHYLTEDAPTGSGTSFFRSRWTGLRSAEEIKTVDEEVITFGVDGAHLLDRTAWDEVDRVGNVFDRLVLWDARMIHAATDYFGTTPENGRLFEMFFFTLR